jgi:hypothetical protein
VGTAPAWRWREKSFPTLLSDALHSTATGARNTNSSATSRSSAVVPHLDGHGNDINTRLRKFQRLTSWRAPLQTYCNGHPKKAKRKRWTMHLHERVHSNRSRHCCPLPFIRWRLWHRIQFPFFPPVVGNSLPTWMAETHKAKPTHNQKRHLWRITSSTYPTTKSPTSELSRY